MQFNRPILSLCIICITDLPFLMLAGYAISIRQNDYNLFIIQNMLFGSISSNGLLIPSTHNFVNVFNSFVWTNLTVFYLVDVPFILNSRPPRVGLEFSGTPMPGHWDRITVSTVFRFHKDKSNKSYPGVDTLEYLSIPERMMASPRDMVLYFHIFAFIACIAVYKYLF